MQLTLALSCLVAAASLATALPQIAAGTGNEPYRALAARATATVPAASTSTDPHDKFDAANVNGITCTGQTNIPKTDQLAAELKICGGIQAPINNCGGDPSSTTGTSGAARWTLTAPQGATINVFKGLWEECCNAGRAACPGQTFTGTCVGGVTSGKGFTFALSQA